MEKTFREENALDNPIFSSAARKSQNPTPLPEISSSTSGAGRIWKPNKCATPRWKNKEEKK
jgi:hypothetical protein